MTTIRSISRGGVQFNFENGKTLSIMFGTLNYGSNHAEGIEPQPTKNMEATSVEVGIFDKDEEGDIRTWYDYETLEVSANSSRDVAGWIPVDEALALIPKVRKMK
jgi:hypothetical protein